jgi:ADP-ribose pyrophosphatase
MVLNRNDADHTNKNAQNPTSNSVGATLNDSAQHRKSFVAQDGESPLRTIHEEIVYRENGGASFAVTQVTAENAKTGEHLSIHYASVKDGLAGAVCVAQLDGSDCLLMARHWRVTTQNWAWEFPRGMGEAGETAATTALREFHEETGMAAKPDSGLVLQYMHADTGVLKDSIAVVSLIVETGEDSLSKDAATKREHDWELSNMRWVSAADIAAMISQEAIDDGITLAAYAVWRARKRP